MKVSLIIPTFNEVSSIGQVLGQVPKNWIEEILIIDAPSTDGTIELVKKLGYPIIFQENKGFGSAIITGIKYAKGDVLIFLTADNSQDPRDIPKLLEKIKEGYDLVLASRYLPGGKSEDDTFVTYIGNKFITWLCNRIHRTKFTDSLYFFLAIRKKVLDSIKLNSPDFELCIELPIKVHKAGFKIAEIPSFERKRKMGQRKVKRIYHGLRIILKMFNLLCPSRFCF